MKTLPLILAGLLIASPALAAEEQCKKVDDALDADTAHCVLRVDGRLITDGECRIDIARDGRVYSMADMNSPSYAVVSMDGPSDPLYARWNKGRKGDNVTTVSYGRVRSIDPGNLNRWCWKNNRFALCITAPYLNCDVGPLDR